MFAKEAVRTWRCLFECLSCLMWCKHCLCEILSTWMLKLLVVYEPGVIRAGGVRAVNQALVSVLHLQDDLTVKRPRHQVVIVTFHHVDKHTKMLFTIDDVNVAPEAKLQRGVKRVINGHNLLYFEWTTLYAKGAV